MNDEPIIDATDTQDGRIHGLDALRGVLMMLGVVLHTALVYAPWGWFFSDWTATTPYLCFVFDSIHMFRMPALGTKVSPIITVGTRTVQL